MLAADLTGGGADVAPSHDLLLERDSPDYRAFLAVGMTALSSDSLLPLWLANHADSTKLAQPAGLPCALCVFTAGSVASLPCFPI